MSHEPLLEMIDGRLQLRDPAQPLIHPISVDFMSRDFRRRANEPKAAHLLAKALGVTTRKSLRPPMVIDATAGLGTDAALMAIWGCEVIALERSPVIFKLLEDGCRRADEQGFAALQKLKPLNQSAEDYCGQILKDQSPRPDLVFLDPMYPELKKTALPRKEMQILRNILKVSDLDDVQNLLELTLRVATDRVVIKRPPRAGELRPLGRRPNHSLEGKAVRYDVYLAR